MRFFEFAEFDDNANRLVMILKNYVGRAASKKTPAKLNWAGLNQVLKSSGFEMAADYETFKSLYDMSPVIQNLVSNFDADGITLNVPGAPDDIQSPQDGKSSAEKVDKMAASAVDGQLDQYNKGAQA